MDESECCKDAEVDSVSGLKMYMAAVLRNARELKVTHGRSPAGRHISIAITKLEDAAFRCKEFCNEVEAACEEASPPDTLENLGVGVVG